MTTKRNKHKHKLDNLAHSTDANARFIHGVIMAHPAVGYIRAGLMFNYYYKMYRKSAHIPVARAMAADRLLDVLDYLAVDMGMITPERITFPTTHEKQRGPHPIDIINHNIPLTTRRYAKQINNIPQKLGDFPTSLIASKK